MLKLLAEVLGLAADATEEQVVDAVRAVKKAAGDTALWKARAEDSLTKLENNSASAQKVKELEADVFFMKAKSTFKITAAEEPQLRKIYLRSPEGKKDVEELLEARSDQEYLARVQSLQNVKEPTETDPLSEVEGRAAEYVAKAKADGKVIDIGFARSEVLKADFALQSRYNAAIGVAGAKGAHR